MGFRSWPSRLLAEEILDLPLSKQFGVWTSKCSVCAAASWRSQRSARGSCHVAREALRLRTGCLHSLHGPPLLQAPSLPELALVGVPEKHLL